LDVEDGPKSYLVSRRLGCFVPVMTVGCVVGWLKVPSSLALSALVRPKVVGKSAAPVKDIPKFTSAVKTSAACS